MLSIFLIVSSGVFFLLSLIGFIAPCKAAAPLELFSQSASARNEIRANYGGMHLAMGVSLFMAGWMPHYARAGLCLLTLFLAGLLLGRFVSMAIDGKPNRALMGITGFEIAALILCCGMFFFS